MNILLADDEAGIREGLASFFRLKGLTVTTAATCAEAMERLRVGGFDAVLTDWNLGDGDARAILDHSGVPVIVVSGYPEQVTHGPTLVRVLSKPVAPADMLEELRSLDVGATPQVDKAVPIPTPELSTAPSMASLPEDVRQRFTVILAWAGCDPSDEHVRVRADGNYIELTAQCSSEPTPSSDAAPDADQMVGWLGGDLRFLQRTHGVEMEYRVLAHGGPEGAFELVTSDGVWPPGDLIIDLHRHPLDPSRFLDLLDRIHARPQSVGTVHLCNTPPGWRLLAEASGRGHQMPKTSAAGPCLPEVLAQLWN